MKPSFPSAILHTCAKFLRPFQQYFSIHFWWLKTLFRCTLHQLIAAAEKRKYFALWKFFPQPLERKKILPCSQFFGLCVLLRIFCRFFPWLVCMYAKPLKMHNSEFFLQNHNFMHWVRLSDNGENAVEVAWLFLVFAVKKFIFGETDENRLLVQVTIFPKINSINSSPNSARFVYPAPSKDSSDKHKCLKFIFCINCQCCHARVVFSLFVPFHIFDPLPEHMRIA